MTPSADPGSGTGAVAGCEYRLGEVLEDDGGVRRARVDIAGTTAELLEMQPQAALAAALHAVAARGGNPGWPLLVAQEGDALLERVLVAPPPGRWVTLVDGLPAECLFAVLMQGCAALHVLHDAGFVHGALTRKRLLFAPELGEVCLTWPTAPLLLGRVPQGVRGQLGCFCPEFGYPDRPASPSWDLFALGAITLFALRRETPPEWLSDQDEPLPNLRALVPDLPVGLSAWFARVLAREPSARFATAAEAAAALRRLLAPAGKVVGARHAAALDVGRGKGQRVPVNQDACILAADRSLLPSETDAFCTDDQTSELPFVAGVTDGISLAQAGELAARVVAGDIVEHAVRVQRSPARGSLVVSELFDQANAALGQRLLAMHADPRYASLTAAATSPSAALAAIRVTAEHATAAAAGDSRVYLLRAGLLEQLTIDGDQFTVYLQQGLSPRQAQAHDDARALTFWAGHFALADQGTQHVAPARIDPSRPIPLSSHALFLPVSFTPQPGDVLCCCSDGLSDYVDAGRIDLAEILARQGPAAACRELVAQANAGGGADNISVVVSHLVAAPAAASPNVATTAAAPALAASSPQDPELAAPQENSCNSI